MAVVDASYASSVVASSGNVVIGDVECDVVDAASVAVGVAGCTAWHSRELALVCVSVGNCSDALSVVALVSVDLLAVAPLLVLLSMFGVGTVLSVC